MEKQTKTVAKAACEREENAHASTVFVPGREVRDVRKSEREPPRYPNGNPAAQELLDRRGLRRFPGSSEESHLSAVILNRNIIRLRTAEFIVSAFCCK